MHGRERYLTLLKMAVSDILNPRNPNEMYYYLVTRLVNLFVADHGYLLRLDSNREQAVIIASTLPGEQEITSIPLDSGKPSTIEAILNAEDILTLNDVISSQDDINSTLFKNLSLPVHSIFGIPIIAKEYKLGIVLLAYNSPRRFSSVELNNAREASDQIALAVWSVQQEAELQRNLREANAMSEIALALSETEHIGLDNVLQLIVTSAKELISNVEQAVIHLLDQQEQILTYGAVIGFEDPAGGKRR